MTTRVAPRDPVRVDLPSLTSLRWVAASAVFLHHWKLGPSWVHVTGSSGVSFFFILSGFILVWSSGAGAVDRRTFYRRRFARIFPAELATTLLYIPLAIVIGRIATATDVGLTLFTLTHLQVWVPVREVFYAGNLVVWSLANEAFFYALFPWLLPRLRALGDGALVRVAGICVLVSVVVPALVRPTTTFQFTYWFSYVNPAYRLFEFVLGMCLALLLVRGALPTVRASWAVALAVAAYVAGGYLPLWTTFVVLTLVPYALVVVACAQRDLAGQTGRVLGSRVALVLGAWSFAFYLLHFMVIKVLLWRFDIVDDPATVQVGAIVGSYLVATVGAAVVYYVVERPAARWLRPAPRAAVGPGPGPARS